MTKEEIELNQLKVGEVIEDENGGLWLITGCDACDSGVSYARKLNGATNTRLNYITLQEGPVAKIPNPRRIYAPDWDRLFNPLNLRIVDRPLIDSRPWRTLPAKRKVTIQVEIAEGVNEIEVEGKMVKV